MDTLNHYQVCLVVKPGIISEKTFFEKTQVEILGENDLFFCMKNDHFDKIVKTKSFDRVYNRIEKQSIGFDVDDRVWGTRIRYNLWTRKNKRPSSIRKEIELAVDEKFGGLAKINLDFIK